MSIWFLARFKKVRFYFILFYFILSNHDSLTFFNFFYKILKKIEYNKLLLMKSII